MSREKKYTFLIDDVSMSFGEKLSELFVLKTKRCLHAPELLEWYTHNIVVHVKAHSYGSYMTIIS